MRKPLSRCVLAALLAPWPVMGTSLDKMGASRGAYAAQDSVDVLLEGVWWCEVEFCHRTRYFADEKEGWQHRVDAFCRIARYLECQAISIKHELYESPIDPTYKLPVGEVTFTYRVGGIDETFTMTRDLGGVYAAVKCPSGYAIRDRYLGSLRENLSFDAAGQEVTCVKVPGANSGMELGGRLQSVGMCRPGDSILIGNPVDAGAQNKIEVVVDLAGAGLIWRRTYNSGATPATQERIGARQKPRLARIGAGWRGTYDREVVAAKSYDEATGAYVDIIQLVRDDGSFREFRPHDSTQGTVYVGEFDEIGTLTHMADGWMYATGDGSIERYGSTGLLTDIVDKNGLVTSLIYLQLGEQQVLSEVRTDQGRTLRFGYDSESRIVAVTASDGRSVSYEYAATSDRPLAANLVKVIRPDGRALEYLYSNGGTQSTRNDFLTGIVGPDGRQFATFTYSGGRPQQTTHAGDTALRTHIRVERDGVKASGRDGDITYFKFGDVNGRILPTQFTHKGTTAARDRVASLGYADDGTLSEYVDYDGVRTLYAHDPVSRLEVMRTEAAGTPEERVIRTEWDVRWRKPLRIDELARWTSFQYDERGNLLETTTGGVNDAADPASGYWPSERSTRMSYNARGSLLSVDGPRTDVDDTVRYTYFDSDAPHCDTDLTRCGWRAGDLSSIVSPTGATWRATRYDGVGRLLAWTDANGLDGEQTYDPLGRVVEQRRSLSSGAQRTEAVERQEYDAADNLAASIDADGVRTVYRYDEAQRLVGVNLPSGGRIDYTLNARDQPKTVTVTDRDDNVVYKAEASYDVLGWPTRIKDAYGKETALAYDKKGRVIESVDALRRKTTYAYDSLGRLAAQVVDPAGVAAASEFAYDAIDFLRSVDDPKRLRTAYLRNGLGDLIWQNSPDTGESHFENGEAGLLAASTTAEGRRADHTYDADGRIVYTVFSDGMAHTYSYDQAMASCDVTERFPVGHLSRVNDATGSTEYCYNALGQVTRKVQTTPQGPLTLRYGYSQAGRLSSMTYPGGLVVTYGRNPAGQVSDVRLESPSLGIQELLRDVAWSPLQAPLSWTYGTGRILARTYDLNGRPTHVADARPGGLDATYDYDAAGQVVRLTAGTAVVDWTYDKLGRLTEAKIAGTMREEYTYDGTGNRLSFANVGGTLNYVYPVDSHHLTLAGASRRVYDKDGNTVAMDDRIFTYDASGRMATVSLGDRLAMSYLYNAWGEQIVRKTDPITVVSLYDESGHWIGDYDGEGKPLRQIVWLEDHPVALIEGGRLYDIETDHLGTPRAVIDRSADKVVWSWTIAGEAFGGDAPDEDPDGDGKAFVFDMRFPGQRFDPVTGLNYNYQRYYDAKAGRYIQSDPIGLAGGMSTYAYAYGSPLEFDDPEGLSPPGRVPSAHSWKQPPGVGGDYGNGVKMLPKKPSGAVAQTPGAWPSAMELKYTMVCTESRCVSDSCSRTDDTYKWRDYTKEATVFPSTAGFSQANPGCTCIRADFLDKAIEKRNTGAATQPGATAWEAIEAYSRYLEGRHRRR